MGPRDSKHRDVHSDWSIETARPARKQGALNINETTRAVVYFTARARVCIFRGEAEIIINK